MYNDGFFKFEATNHALKFPTCFKPNKSLVQNAKQEHRLISAEGKRAQLCFPARILTAAHLRLILNRTATDEDNQLSFFFFRLANQCSKGMYGR